MRKNTDLIPRNFMDLIKHTGNIYESTVIISKRAKQIATKTKEELTDKLAEFFSHADHLEEVSENKEHIEISKFYEKQPKPVIVATKEFLADKIMYRYPDEEASIKVQATNLGIS